MSDIASPVVPAKSAPEERGEEPSLEYFRAWTYLFEAPSWLQDLLLCSVGILVPIVGRMVVDGLLWERAGVATGELNGPPSPFDFSHLNRYLMRGVWPFVVTTLLNIVIHAISGAVVVSWLFGFRYYDFTWLTRFSESELMMLVWCVGTPLLLLLLLVIKLTVLLVMAMTFHSERTCSFAAMFDFGFVGAFFYRVWLEAFLVLAFAGFVAPAVMFAGTLCCIIGALPASILVLGAMEFYTWRLYRLYLARGGKPIAIKLLP